MKIIHVVGPICAGKTFLIERAQKKYPIKAFNIKEVHKETGSIGEDGEFNWEVFRKNREKKVVTNRLFQFLVNNRDEQAVFVETSGANQEINNMLKELDWAELIAVPIKPSAKWKEFAEKENMAQDTVENSIKFFYKEVEFQLGYSYTQKEAAKKIKEILEGNECLN